MVYSSVHQSTWWKLTRGQPVNVRTTGIWLLSSWSGSSAASSRADASWRTGDWRVLCLYKWGTIDGLNTWPTRFLILRTTGIETKRALVWISFEDNRPALELLQSAKFTISDRFILHRRSCNFWRKVSLVASGLLSLDAYAKMANRLSIRVTVVKNGRISKSLHIADSPLWSSQQLHPHPFHWEPHQCPVKSIEQKMKRRNK